MNYAGKFEPKLPAEGSGLHPKGQAHVETITSHATHAPADAIIVPDAHLLFSGNYERSGTDLIVSDHEHRVVVHDYFRGEKRPTLVSPEGAPLDAKVVAALTGHTAYAQADGSASTAKVIGHVVKISGSASVVRNGVTVELNNGDNINQGDVAQTGSNSTLGLVLIDGTTFNMTANARLMLNDLVYDANSTSNTSLLTLVQGAASFVAGQVAKTGDMKVATPVATLGIRGTAVTMDIDLNSGEVSISVVDQHDQQVHTVQVFDRNGNVIGTVTSNGSSLKLTPTASFEVIANYTDKTPAQVAQEFRALQNILDVYNDWKQAHPETPQHTDATPHSTGPSGSSPANPPGNSNPNPLNFIPPDSGQSKPIPINLHLDGSSAPSSPAPITPPPTIILRSVDVTPVVNQATFSIADIVKINDSSPSETIVPFVPGTGKVLSVSIVGPGNVPAGIDLTKFILVNQQTGQVSYDPANFAFLGENRKAVITVGFDSSAGSEIFHLTTTDTINGVNSSPVITAAALTVGVGGTVLLTPANVGVTDPDNTSFTFTVSNVTHGTFQATTDGVHWTGTTTFTSADLAASHVRFVQDGSVNAPTFSIQADDGASLNHASNVFAGSVSFVDEAPVITVPGAQTLAEDTSKELSGISISDADSGDSSLTTTLSVLHGTLTVGSAGGAAVTGSGTGTVTLTGTIAQINATLAAADNVVYNAVHEFSGSDTLTVHTDDGGNAGTSATVAITVNPVADAPILSGPLAHSVSDSLTSSTLDPTKWQVYLPTHISGADDASVTPTDGGVQLHDRGYLQTASGFTPTSATPLHVTFNWTFSDSGDYLVVTDRTNGATEPTYGGTLNGIDFVANWRIGDSGALLIVDHASGNFVRVNASLVAGQAYAVSITDDGAHQTFVVTDASGQVIASAESDFASPAAGNLVTFTNREGNGGPHTAIISNVAISTAYHGLEDGSVALTGFAAAVSDTDGSETMVLKISGFPSGAIFSKGALVTDVNSADFNKWVISDPADIASLATTPLTVTPPVDFSGDFTLHVDSVVTAAATLPSGVVTDTKTSSQDIAVTVAPIADALVIQPPQVADPGPIHAPAGTPDGHDGFLPVVLSNNFTFTDAEFLDSHVITATFDAAASNLGPLSEHGPIGTFAENLLHDSTGGNQGLVNWSFTLSSSDLTSINNGLLPAGSTVHEVFDVTVSDGHGDIAVRQVSIEIDGPASPIDNWTGLAGGTEWSTAGNWDNGVPGANSEVNITASGAIVAFDSSAPSGTIDSLSTNGGTTLNITGGALVITGSGTSDLQGATNNSGNLVVENGTLQFDGSLTNSGELRAASHATIDIAGDITNTGTGTIVIESNSVLLVDNYAVNLAGGGHVSLGGGQITENTADQYVVNSGMVLALDNVDNTISGAGTIGNGIFHYHGTYYNRDIGSLALKNEQNATIDANVSGATLTLNTGNTITNIGLMEATNGGTLVVQDAVTNSGTIAANGGLVQIQGALTDTGGTALIQGAGTLEIGVADGQTVAFTGSGGTLQIDSTVSGGPAAGISATATDGAAITIQGSGNVTSAAADAIDVVSAAGDVAITLGGQVTGALAGLTVTQNGLGNIGITTNGSVIGHAGNGIVAEQSSTGVGSILVKGNSAVTGMGEGSIGVLAENLNAANGGNITVTQLGGASGGKNGILAVSHGNGTVMVESAGKVAATVQYGIRAESYGTGNITVLTDLSSEITSGSSGIYAVNEDASIASSANSVIEVNAFGTINSGTNVTGTGKPPAGILAGYLGGTTNPTSYPVPGLYGAVMVNSFADINAAAGDGIRAFNYGIGDITVNDNAGTITALGGTNPTNGFGDGISANNFGTGNIHVTTAAGTVIHSGGSGIHANNDAAATPSSSLVSVVAHGTITSGNLLDGSGNPSAGILAGYYFDGLVDPNVHGNVIIDDYASITAANGTDGIRGYNYGTGTVTITVEAGAVVNGPRFGVGAFAKDGGNVMVTNYGSVTGGTDAVNAQTTGTGTATIDNHGHLIGDLAGYNATFTNELNADWSMNGTSRFAGASTLSNAGTIESNGTSVVSGLSGITNTGTIEVQSGSLKLDATILGAGALKIDAGSTLELASGVSSGQTVTFGATTGTLKLDNAQNFHGVISGLGTQDGTLAHSDLIDLANINHHSTSFSEQFDSTTDTLTVTDGTNTAVIHLTGSYSNNSFHFVDDGNLIGGVSGTSGTIVYDPPASSGQAVGPVVAHDPGPGVGGVVMHDPGPAPNQTIVASVPNQTLTGYGSSDTYVFNFKAVGHDTVTDFNPATDALQFASPIFANAQAALNAAQDDGHGNTVVTLDAQDTITLAGVAKAQLHATDFHIV